MPNSFREIRKAELEANVLYLPGMYKSQYTPHEAQEQFKLIDESSNHDAYKERAKRYIRNRTVESQELTDK